MANSRKTQGEIDRLMKKIGEGMDVYEDTYEKFQGASTTSLKERYEAELKKEIKKLQRLREQIKVLTTSGEVKDKKALEKARKDIEGKMEAFKSVEKETKTKAFSKEGLANTSRIDPADAAKHATGTWIRDAISEIGSQIESLEFDIENEGNRKRKGGSGYDPREERLNRSKFHVSKLEQLLRLMENDELSPEDIDEITSDVQGYVEGNADEDYVEDFEDLYECFDLPEAPVKKPEDENSDGEEEPKASPVTTRAEKKAQKQTPLTPAATTSAFPATPTTPPTSKAAPKTPAAVPAAKKEVPAPQPKAKEVPAPAAKPVKEAPAPAAQAKKVVAAVQPQVKAVPPQPAGSVKQQQQPASPAAVINTKAVPASPTREQVAPATPVLSGYAAVASQAVQQESQQAKNLAAMNNAPSLGGMPASPVNPQAAGGNGNGGGAMGSEAMEGQLTVDDLMDDDDGLNDDTFGDDAMGEAGDGMADLAAMNQGWNKPLEKLPPKPPQAAVAEKPKAPAAAAPQQQQQQTQQQSTTGHQQTTAQQQASSQQQAAHQAAVTMLEQSVKNLPHPNDAERLKAYIPPNPYKTPAWYPQSIHSSLTHTETLSKFEIEALFFIFYYQPNTYQQYLAAKELKKQSWRYHKKYLTWFQRHDTPKQTTDDFEQGAYIYFDFESGWCQRIKNDFTFKYQFLEDELQ